MAEATKSESEEESKSFTPDQEKDANTAYEIHHIRGWVETAQVQLAQGKAAEVCLTLACLNRMLYDKMTGFGLSAVEQELLPVPTDSPIRPPPNIEMEGGNK